jgi:hypothetical protein
MNQESGQPSGFFNRIQSLFQTAIWKQWLPSRGNFVFTLLVALGLIWAQSSGVLARGAETGSGFTRPIPYQGRLADASGAPLTDSYAMVFRLYASNTDISIPLWEENWVGTNSVKVSGGLFSVMLGSLIPIPETVITQNDNLWLGITVENDKEMTPRIQLGTVPFAHQAQTVPDGSITTPKLENASVTTLKLGDGAVTRAKLDPAIVFVPDNSLSTIKLMDGAVTKAKLGADVIFTPPDGSVTNAKIANGSVSKSKLAGDVSNYQIESGYECALNGTTPGWNLAVGHDERYFHRYVTFGVSYGNVTPTVVTSLRKIDGDKGYNQRIDAYPENISPTGFDLIFHTWADSIVHGMCVSWIAY